MRLSRSFIIVLVVVVCAALGAVIAWTTGKSVMLSAVALDLSAYTQRVLARGNTIADEYTTIAREVTEGTQPFCSPADVARLRDFAYHSHYTKDVGRVRSGKIICTSVLGRLAVPYVEGVPDLVTPRGAKIFTSARIGFGSRDRALVVERFGVTLVVSPDAFAGLDSPPMRYLLTVVDPPAHKVVVGFGDVGHIAPMFVYRTGPFRSAEASYDAGCSKRYYICAVTTESDTDLFAAQLPMLTLFAIFGLIAGGGLGLSGGLLWNASRTLTAQLRRAVRRGAIGVAYQPVGTTSWTAPRVGTRLSSGPITRATRP